jgi:hypothetical protein
MAELPSQRSCGAYDVHVEMLRTNLDYARARAAIDAQVENFARSARAAERVGPSVIPVVVHIIFRAVEENISDQQIKSQIDVLNRDYRMRNPDVATVPAPFLAVGKRRSDRIRAGQCRRGRPTYHRYHPHADNSPTFLRR